MLAHHHYSQIPAWTVMSVSSLKISPETSRLWGSFAVAPSSDGNVNRELRCELANENSVTLDLWSTVSCDTGQRWNRQLTDMGHGFGVTKTDFMSKGSSQNKLRS